MADTKKQKHKSPPIPAGWDIKITGPAWRGEPTEQARAMWAAHLRRLAAHARPMPRTTQSPRT